MKLFTAVFAGKALGVAVFGKKDYQQLMKELFELVYYSDLSENQKKAVLMDLGEFMYRDNSILDHEIGFFCCVLAMENSIKAN
jgi:hypothetical protein